MEGDNRYEIWTKRRTRLLLNETRTREEELERRGGVLLKTSGETKGNPGESGTGYVIYH